MILSEFIRVMDIGWIDFLRGLAWFFLVVGGYTFAVSKASRISARQAFIKNELPKVHNSMLKKERIKNNKLEIEKKRLFDESKLLLTEKEKLQARLILIKEHYEAGLKEDVK